MADLIPNDLSHLDDDQFNALCPLGYHAPGPEPLTPAAQEVLEAYGYEIGGTDAIMGSERRGLAAALRALAEHKQKSIVYGKPIDFWTPTPYTRQELLNIASELENYG